MSKTMKSICLDSDKWELISEIKTNRRLKTDSQTLNYIISQWQMLLDVYKKSQKTPISPPTDEIKKEKIRQDPMDDPKWAFLHAKPEDPNLRSTVKLKKSDQG